MKYKALISFAGAVSMGKGEIKEIEDKAIINDLLDAKYIEPAEVKTTTKKTAKKK